MIIKIKRKTLKQGILSVFLLFAIVSVLIGVSFTTNYVIGEPVNYTNATVIAILNVTNTEPNITGVIVDDDISNPADEIDLATNAFTVVTCNATIFDYNGYKDIMDTNATNATFFMNSVGLDSADDNNSHYTNRSCGRCVQGSSSTRAVCDCRFAMQYYANDTVWRCNISITDKGGTGRPGQVLNFTRTGADTTTVTKLLALDTPTTMIDYGNLSVTQISAAIQRNVTNAGNVDLNLTFRGFGGENDSITNDTFAMVCNYGNISFGYHRYIAGLNVSFSEMTNLTNQTVNTNFTLPQRTNDAPVGIRKDINETYWRLEIPLSVGGLCNGTIIFGATETLG